MAPIYEYNCSKCGNFEISQSIKDEALTICPKCKKEKITRIISQCSVSFRGEGWTPKFSTKNEKNKNK